MIKLGFVLLSLIVLTCESQADVPRRELAKGIFNFVHKHAIRDPNNPLDYAYQDAYELHLTAKHLYDIRRPIERVHCPDSVFERGAYKPYAITVHFRHEFLLAEIKGMARHCDRW